MVYCFDLGKSKRYDLLPTYKEKRNKRKLSQEHAKAYGQLRKQIDVFREELLPYLGIENVFYADGYEADDVIASVVHNLPKGEEAIIVSADKDLLQLLRVGVCVWNPTTKKLATAESFYEEWKLPPRDWSEIKAIAGCNTDQIKGIKGIGEKTAAKYVRGELSEKEIERFMRTIETFVRSGKCDANMNLVKLPFEGCPKFVPNPKDSIDRKRWKKLTKKLNMKSIRDANPNYSGFAFEKGVK